MSPLNKQLILTVDDTPLNLDILNGILSNDYDIKSAINGKIALKIAEAVIPDIILLDIMMPDMDGYEVCKRLKANPKTSHIPVIFVTAMLSPEDEEKGFKFGAVDYITKPINPAIVKVRVKTHLSLANQQKACMTIIELQVKELHENQKAAIHMLGTAGHYNDTDTGSHIWRMADYSAALARAANWSVSEVEAMKLAATMHDTGKIGIPDDILKAPRKLTSDEWKVMKMHSEIGHKILSNSPISLFQMASEIALSHHEKWNGSGYPNGLAENDIPESARIVAIGDVFDALTTKRPYKEAWPIDKAFAVLIEDSGTHFDPKLIQLFISIKSEILEIKEDWEKQYNSL